MKTVFEIIVLLLIAIVWWLAYLYYWDDIKDFFYGGEPEYVVHVSDVALSVTVADTYEERVQGLSGVEELGDFEGKLFIFDESGHHGIWMKDMVIPIDVMWFDDELNLIHVQRNMSPESFPEVYAPPEPARFVLETKAYFVDALQLEDEIRLILPPQLLPVDVRENLQE